MAKIPKFKSLEEEQDFWQKHDSMDYLDDTEEVGGAEVATINQEAKDLRVAGVLRMIRSELGEEVAESLQRMILELIDKRCRELGTSLDDVLTRKRAA